jgi:hypothetical protein
VMFTRSDWPETGLPGAIGDAGPAAPGQSDWVDQTRVGSLGLRWVASTDAFESGLYQLPVVSARVEMEASDAASLARAEGKVEDDFLHWIRTLVAAIPWPECYLLAKVVPRGLLHDALAECGFAEVERRSLYRTRVGDVSAASPGSGFVFTTMAEVEPGARARYRGEMLEICAEAFASGHSRHFKDPFLLARAPGLAYIRAAMQLNFERVDAAFLLLATDPVGDRLCGFSVVGPKRGLPGETFTQLLTGVREEYRGRGVYQGLTGLLKRALPPDGVLLNATHADNAAMEAAYRRSGRIHLADTVVLRRVFDRSRNPS